MADIQSPCSITPLERLRDLENGPRRKWTADDRVLLLVLKRWYIADRTDFVVIFNNMTRLTLKSKVFDSQFAELKSKGPKASEEWDNVFDLTTFGDDTWRFNDVRRKSS